jgi:hypothetical protein
MPGLIAQLLDVPGGILAGRIQLGYSLDVLGAAAMAWANGSGCGYTSARAQVTGLSWGRLLTMPSTAPECSL